MIELRFCEICKKWKALLDTEEVSVGKHWNDAYSGREGFFNHKYQSFCKSCLSKLEKED